MKNAGSRATKSRSAILIPSRDPQLRGRTRNKPSKMKSSLFPSVVVGADNSEPRFLLNG